MVTIRDLHYSYRRKPVLSGLDLQLQPNQIYGLLGRNGTGKSTLLRNIAGFLFPQQGSIDALGFSPGQRRPAFLERVFLVPEEFDLPATTLERWVRSLSPFYSLFDQQQFEHYIREFDIPPAVRLTELSYGQQKKVFISFALATNAPVLLMDEPTNGLDIPSKSQFRKIIAGAVDENRCILISTHQVKDLEQLVDRVTIIEEGRILFDQTMETISEKLLFKFSESPEETATALYSETSFRGNAIILPNLSQEESRPDLELLYKAILLQSRNINALFK
ncbi:MAG TPA: ABC transporter ATP-binding protein, partial [Puia sp.]|nr:ABC transporter ATP-binding protein [Puia sp.]